MKRRCFLCHSGFWKLITLPQAFDNKLMILCELYRNLQVKTHQTYSWRKEKQPFGRLKRRSINFRCLYLASLIHMKFPRRCAIKKQTNKKQNKTSFAVFFLYSYFVVIEENSTWIFVDQNDANL